MEKSSSLVELTKALVAFQAEIGPIAYDADNPFFKSKYATLAQLVKKASPIVAKHGLAVIQPLGGTGAVTTILLHTSGEFIQDTMELKPVKDDPQGHGSSITYARRYGYASILGLVSEEDDDANTATDIKKKEYKKPEVIPVIKNILEEHIGQETGNQLLKALQEKGYNKEDLKQMISFQFELDSILEIKNKHLGKIQEFFKNPKKIRS